MKNDSEIPIFLVFIGSLVLLLFITIICSMWLKTEESKAKICFDYAERGQKVVVFKDKDGGFHCELLKEKNNEM